MGKKNSQFNILSNNSTTHGGYSIGTLNLSNLSSVLIDEDVAKIDLGLIHAKSSVERGIKFTSNIDEIPEGKAYWVAWIGVDRDEKGPHYAGVAVCPMKINKELRKGWKNLAMHVNRMDDALKRKIKLDELPEREKQALKQLLINHSQDMWENSKDELKEKLG